MDKMLTLFYFSIFLLPKAALEWLYFHEPSSAKKTMIQWLGVLLVVSTCFGLSLLFDYLG